MPSLAERLHNDLAFRALVLVRDKVADNNKASERANSKQTSSQSANPQSKKTEQTKSEQKIHYCPDYNKESCIFDDHHPGKLNGKDLYHICKRCLFAEGKHKKSHPETDVNCPSKIWLGQNSSDLVAHNKDSLNEFYIKAHKIIKRSGKYNFQHCKIPVPIKWNLDHLDNLLSNYEDRDIVQLLRFGWPIELKHTLQSVVAPHNNQKGAEKNPNKVSEYINKELDKQSIIGPFSKSPFGNGTRISPIDAIPKKDSTDLRVILNLSYPPDSDLSLNDAVDKDSYLGKEVKLQYPKIDDLVDLIKSIGVGCAIFKTDLNCAYRQIYYDPGCIHLVAFRVNNLLYFDVTLSQGLRIACYICQRITSAFMFIYYDRGFCGINYLDDLAGAELWSAAYVASKALSDLLEELGVAVHLVNPANWYHF